MRTQTDHQLTKTHVELKSTQRIETQRGKTVKLKIAYFNRWRDGEARWASGADRSKGYHDLLLLQLVDFLSHDSKTRDSATLRQIPARTNRAFVSPVRGMRFDVSPVQINPKGNAMDQFWGRGVHHEKIGLKLMPFLVWAADFGWPRAPAKYQSWKWWWAWRGELSLARRNLFAHDPQSPIMNSAPAVVLSSKSSAFSFSVDAHRPASGRCSWNVDTVVT